jgi:hypothetical protein
MEHLHPHWRNFHQIWYLSILLKCVEKIQVPLKSDRNNWYLTWRPMHICNNTSLSSSQNEKCVRWKLQRTDILR